MRLRGKRRRSRRRSDASVALFSRAFLSIVGPAAFPNHRLETRDRVGIIFALKAAGRGCVAFLVQRRTMKGCGIRLSAFSHAVPFQTSNRHVLRTSTQSCPVARIYECTVRPNQASRPAITQATQLAHRGMSVLPTVIGHPADARSSCSTATMAKMAPERRAKAVGSRACSIDTSNVAIAYRTSSAGQLPASTDTRCPYHSANRASRPTKFNRVIP